MSTLWLTVQASSYYHVLNNQPGYADPQDNRLPQSILDPPNASYICVKADSGSRQLELKISDVALAIASVDYPTT